MKKSGITDGSTKKISPTTKAEIITALKNIRGWGSVEIFVQDHRVVQITERNIKKIQQTQNPRSS